MKYIHDIKNCFFIFLIGFAWETAEDWVIILDADYVETMLMGLKWSIDDWRSVVRAAVALLVQQVSATQRLGARFLLASKLKCP